jgi:hypothetical protein
MTMDADETDLVSDRQRSVAEKNSNIPLFVR